MHVAVIVITDSCSDIYVKAVHRANSKKLSDRHSGAHTYMFWYYLHAYQGTQISSGKKKSLHLHSLSITRISCAHPLYFGGGNYDSQETKRFPSGMWLSGEQAWNLIHSFCIPFPVQALFKAVCEGKEDKLRQQKLLLLHSSSRVWLTMQSHLLLSCLLLSMTLSWSYATPLPSEAADGPHDVRWRLVSGMETAYRYAIKLVGCTHVYIVCIT